MAISIDEYEHYISEARNFETPALNGGTVGDLVAPDSLNVIFPEIIASEREIGVVKRSKIFMKNGSADRKMLNNIVFLKQDLLPPDKIRLIEATEKDDFAFILDETIDGSVNTLVAGTAFLIKNVSGVLISDLVGREITLLDIEFTISSFDEGASTISLDLDIDFDISIDTKMQSSDNFKIFESDEDFTSIKRYLNSVITEGLSNGVTEIIVPRVDAPYFDADDTVVIVDGYHRVLYRGELLSLADHATNIDSSIATLKTAYTGVAIPPFESYLCNGIKNTMIPGQIKSYWLELEVQPESAIDSEVVNQFQTGASFDDVAAV